MGEILKFPGDATLLGYRRVRRRRRSEDPNQLDLFLPSPVPITSFAPSLSAFEQALQCDERSDPRAAEFYARAIELGDQTADANCNLGILESKRGNTAKAFDCFTCALKHDPRHLEAHYNLANLYFDANDFRLAQLHYELAAEIDPEFANIYYNLALVQSLNHDLRGAIDTLLRYQQLAAPEDARQAEQLLDGLRRSLAIKQGTSLGG